MWIPIKFITDEQINSPAFIISECGAYFAEKDKIYKHIESFDKKHEEIKTVNWT